MTRYLAKDPVVIERWLKFGSPPDVLFVDVKYFDVIEDREDVDLTGKSMHAIGQMIASRDATIKKLQKEIADLRIGGQPASQFRDAVLPVLLKATDLMASKQDATLLLNRLIAHLKSIPTLEPPSDKVAEKGGVKPYKPLDHGTRDLEAADPKYRGTPDLAQNKL